KALRRGIEDAGYVALARAARPSEADAIVAGLLPAALDELSDTAPSALPGGGGRVSVAGGGLPARGPRGAAPSPPASPARRCGRRPRGGAFASRRSDGGASWRRAPWARPRSSSLSRSGFFCGVARNSSRKTGRPPLGRFCPRGTRPLRTHARSP